MFRIFGALFFWGFRALRALMFFRAFGVLRMLSSAI